LSLRAASHPGIHRAPHEVLPMTVIPLRPTFNLADLNTLKLDFVHNPRQAAKDIVALVEIVEADAKANPELGPLPVQDGWNNITPEIARNLLHRNRANVNRKIEPATVIFYAQQMADGEWKKTGQPILIRSDGILADSQHRCYGGLISGVTFPSYVVTGIEPIPNLFAYIDNARSRTAATALETAGFNGQSPTIVKVVRIGEDVKHGVYNPGGAEKLPRMSPAELVRHMENYPNAQRAARSAASEWNNAVEYIGCRKEIVAYLGMRIFDLHSEEVADDFFYDLVTVETRQNRDPIGELRKVIESNKQAERPMKPHHLLATLITAFNAWHAKVPLPRRWVPAVNEDFPVIDSAPAEIEAQVAE
jgi:hypothetical protein